MLSTIPNRPRRVRNPSRQDILTAVIASIASPNKNTKIKKLSHSDATTVQDHQHHLEAEIVILREIHRTTITIRKTITVVDVVEQRDMKL